MRKALRTIVPVAVIAIAAAACGGDVAFESASQSGAAESDAGTLVALLELAEDAPWETRFHGTRRIESRFFEPSFEKGQEVTLAYREEVWADGGGNFALETIELLSFVPDPELFEVTQQIREGFLYRYRDFAVHDLSALYQSSLVTDLDETVQVAGRTCRKIRIEPATGGRTYHLALDVETGLALRGIETDADGVEVHRVEFESYDANPDLSRVVWFQPEYPETALDPAGDLALQAGFEVMEPLVLPDGYQLWKAATLVDPNGRTWIKLTYTNGIEPLFLLHGAEPAMTAIVAPGASAAVAGVPSSDVVWKYPIGPVHVAEGRLRSYDVVALGKVDEESLLDMLESAID